MKEKVWEYFSGHIVLKCDPYTTPYMYKTYFEQKTSWILQNVSKREEQIGKENGLLSKDKPCLYSMRSYYYIYASHAERSFRVASANSWISHRPICSEGIWTYKIYRKVCKYPNVIPLSLQIALKICLYLAMSLTSFPIGN